MCLDIAGSFKTSYTLSTIAEFLLFSEGEWFEIHDGFDGTGSEHFRREDVAKMFVELRRALPGSIGRFRISVGYQPTDYSVPF